MESKGQGETWQDIVRDHGDQQTRFPLRKQNQNLMEKVPPAPGGGPSPCLLLAPVMALKRTTVRLLFHPVRNGVFSAVLLSAPPLKLGGAGEEASQIFSSLVHKSQNHEGPHLDMMEKREPYPITAWDLRVSFQEL